MRIEIVEHENMWFWAILLGDNHEHILEGKASSPAEAFRDIQSALSRGVEKSSWWFDYDRNDINREDPFAKVG